MFLVTTANQLFWKTDEKILFLGEWCRLYEEKSVWSKLDHEVLPWHWCNRKKLLSDFQYLQQLNGKILHHLGSKLNELHGVNHSNRYWQITLGAWLIYFIEIFYDRFASYKNAIESQKASHTWITSQDISTRIPVNFAEFENWLGHDSYNFLIYSWIIQELKDIPFEIKNDISAPFLPEKYPPKTNVNWKTLTKKLITAYSRCVPDRLNQIVFYASYIDRIELSKLQISLGQFPYLDLPQIDVPQTQINGELRKSLKISFAENQFEALLEKIIPQQIPKVYVEGYSEMHRRALRSFPKSPKLIFSSIGLYTHEGFKFWAAAMVERGVKLIGSQHGGHYGSSLISTKEEHEIACSDHYISWGWKKENTSKVIPLPSGKLAKACRSLKSDPTGNILFIDMEDFLQIYSIFSGHIGTTMVQLLKNHQCFVESLRPEVRRLLFVRLYTKDQGWGAKERWESFDPNISVYRGREPLFEQINRSRLLVIPYDSTSHLEALAANFPTLFYWKPDLTELRPSAQHDHELMHEVGIFHKSPESVAAKINQIYQNPLEWWLSAETQKARIEFCRLYAWTERTWPSQLKNKLLSIAGK